MENALLRKSISYYICKLEFHWVEKWLDLIFGYMDCTCLLSTLIDYLEFAANIFRTFSPSVHCMFPLKSYLSYALVLLSLEVL